MPRTTSGNARPFFVRARDSDFETSAIESSYASEHHPTRSEAAAHGTSRRAFTSAPERRWLHDTESGPPPQAPVRSYSLPPGTRFWLRMLREFRQKKLEMIVVEGNVPIQVADDFIWNRL